MKNHVLLTRPAENAVATQRLLEKRGFRVTLAPMLVCEQLESIIPTGSYDGIIITSVYAVASLSKMASGRESLPVFVTGAATQQAVHDDGWHHVVNVEGGALDIVDGVGKRFSDIKNVLYPCAEQTAHDLDALFSNINIKCTSWPVYRMNAVDDLSCNVREALACGDVDSVLLYSARTAAVFAGLTENTLPETLSILALSEEIAKALGEPLGNRAVYPALKTEKALLSLLD